MAKYIKYMLELLEHGMIHVITLTFQEEFSRNGFSLLRPFLGPPGVCQEGHHGGKQQEYVKYFENTFDIYIYPNCSQGIQWDMYNNTWRYLQPLHAQVYDNKDIMVMCSKNMINIMRTQYGRQIMPKKHVINLFLKCKWQ